jgi:hypothetical protein
LLKVCLYCALTFPAMAAANDVEPRLFSNVPVGTNFLSLGYAHSEGEVTFDSSVPISDADGEVNSMVLSYSRGLDIAGKSALLSVVVPYGELKLEGLYLGEPASGGRQGWADPRIRLAMNFYGAPAMTPEEFRSYRQKTIIGASVSVGIPVGRYLEDRLLNVGTNRWSVIGQVGISQRLNKWTAEAAAGFAWLSKNDEVLETNTLEQDAIGLVRATLIYHFRPGLWAGAGMVYTYGGATTLNGETRDDEQGNWRTGVTLSTALARGHNLQLRATDGLAARLGADFTTYAVSYTYTF